MDREQRIQATGTTGAGLPPALPALDTPALPARTPATKICVQFATPGIFQKTAEIRSYWYSQGEDLIARCFVLGLCVKLINTRLLSGLIVLFTICSGQTSCSGLGFCAERCY